MKLVGAFQKLRNPRHQVRRVDIPSAMDCLA